MSEEPQTEFAAIASSLKPTCVISGPRPPDQPRSRRWRRSLSRYFKKPPVIDRIFVLAVILVITRKFASLSFDNRIGVTGSDLLYTLASAYVTGWIFYLIVTRYPNWITKRRVYESVAKEVSAISATARALLVASLVAASENPYGPIEEPPLKPDEDYALRVFSTININDLSPTLSDDNRHQNTWNEYFFNLVTGTEQQIQRLSSVYFFLPSEAIASMNEILYSQFGSHCHTHKASPPTASTDFSSQVVVFMDYWNACYELLQSYINDIEPFTCRGYIYRWDVTTRSSQA